MFLFLLIFVIIFAPSGYFFRHVFSYFVYCFLAFFIKAFFITWFLGFLSLLGDIVRKSAITIIILFLTLLNIPRLLGVSLWGLPMTGDIWGIILPTTFVETCEFLQFSISPQVIIVSISFFIIIGFFIYFSVFKKYNFSWFKYSQRLGFALLIIAIPAIIRNNNVLKEGPIQEISFALEGCVKIKDHMCHPTIVEIEHHHPQRIVVIIGESFSKYHSNLYGYSRITNPNLTDLYNQKKLFVFRNVKSPANSTQETFKYLLNTQRLESIGEWYDTPNLIEVMNLAGYYTTWVSNQAQRGASSNISSGSSELCKEYHFRPRNSYKQALDYDLLKMFHDAKDNAQENRVGYTLDVFHLIGQHQVYRLRYPKTFGLFKNDDYMDYPQNQRENRATYDNATLYNDYVVNAIISEYKDEEAIVFYLSDHGLDLYYCDDDYCSNGRPTNTLSSEFGKDIPFMIYVSDSFRDKYPEKVKQIEKSVDNDYCTDSFIFTVMDVAGIDFIDSKYKTGKSIIKR